MISNSLIHLRFRLLSELYSLLYYELTLTRDTISGFRLLSELYSLLLIISLLVQPLNILSFRLLSELYSLLFKKLEYG